MSNENETTEVPKAPEEPVPEKTSIVDDAHKAAERLEKATAEMKVQASRLEKIQSFKMLGGSTEAGQAPTAVTPERKALNSAIDYFKGTQLEQDIRKANE